MNEPKPVLLGLKGQERCSETDRQLDTKMRSDDGSH